MCVLCKVSAILCKIFDCMAPSKYFSSFAGTDGFTMFMILLLLWFGRVVGGRIECMGDFELEKHNGMHINISTIKTIQSEDGDIIDCVDILKQLALNHPLLKNHTLQMRPSLYHRELETNFSSKSRPVNQIWQRSGSCPVGTVPIRRNTEEGVPKAFHFNGYGGEVTNISQARIDKAGIALLYNEQKKHWGAKGSLNVWSLNVALCEFTSNLMILSNHGRNSLIYAGWTVHPAIYGDYRSRLTTYWRHGNSGCFDLRCPGFVQVNQNILLGGALEPLSVYGGAQYQIGLQIKKEGRNWTLYFGSLLVGHWPDALFNHDLYWADVVQWSGIVFRPNPAPHTPTEMGSGHYAAEGYSHAAYMAGIQTMDAFSHFEYPVGISYINSNPRCYTIQPGTGIPEPGASFFYGGPGCSTN